MLHDRINVSAGICPGQNETQLTDHTMNHICSVLLELICPNGQRSHVAIVDQLLAGATGIGIVKVSVGIHTILSIFEISVPQNIRYAVVLMSPAERYLCTVLILKGIRQNYALVRAFNIGFRGIAMKVAIGVFQFHT